MTDQELAELEAKEKNDLAEVAAIAKSKGLKMKWASDLILVIGTNDHRGEFKARKEGE